MKHLVTLLALLGGTYALHGIASEWQAKRRRERHAAETQRLMYGPGWRIQFDERTYSTAYVRREDAEAYVEGIVANTGIPREELALSVVWKAGLR